MYLIDKSISNGTAVVVGMILVVLFGLLALTRIPIQLNPTVDQPIITIETEYPGAAPSEVESEITRRQEERLAAVENVRRMKSVSREGQAEVTLEFDWGVNKDLANLDIIKKLNLVDNLPDDAEEEQIFATTSDEGQSIMRITVQSSRPVNDVRELLEDRVGPRLERVDGVSRVQWYGGSRREIQVKLDLAALEARRVTVSEVLEALARENQTLRGGKIEGGATRMLVRTVGQFESLDEIRRIIIKNDVGGAVRMEDIARVVDGYRDQERIGRTMGEPAVSMGISKRSGENTLKVTEGLEAEIEKINNEYEAQDIHLWINYNVADYIWESIATVRHDLIYGAILSIAVLVVFLRSFSATFAISLTIPVCAIGTFVLLAAFDRSLNVISLAGLAFATGMVVDDGIVVVENIFRHRAEYGSDPWKAAHEATHEVWAPVLASTLTTLAVFIPVLFIQEEAGQLFRDIAYSISFAVGLSLIASITIVPMIMSRLARSKPKVVEGESAYKAGPLAWIGNGTVALFMNIVRAGLRSQMIRGTIIVLILVGFAGSFLITPPAEYLPQSGSKFIFGNIVMPSGMSLEGADHLIKKVEEHCLKLPNIHRVFFIATRDRSFFGIFLQRDKVESEDVDGIAKGVEEYAQSVLPADVRVSVSRGSDFAWRSGGGKNISVDIAGPDMDRLQALSEEYEDRLTAVEGTRSVISSLNVANPELRVRPNRERLSDLGLTARDLAIVVETLLEGRRASLYREGGKEYDLVVEAEDDSILHPDRLKEVILKSPDGRDVRLDEIATIERALGPVSIQRLEQERAVTLTVNIEDEIALETYINRAESEVMTAMRDNLPPGYTASLSGTVDDLRRTIRALSGSFILALIITYLLLAALFESFMYPLIIMFSVPLAMTGAFIGVRVTGSEFNVITMLGLILLAGIVVKNAILLVEFTLLELKKGVAPHDAILNGIKVRIRPIFMTSATTVLGMLPLVWGGGAGSELYQGLGAAVVGGMTLSTIFTLVLIPLLMASMIEAIEWLKLTAAGVPVLGSLVRRMSSQNPRSNTGG